MADIAAGDVTYTLIKKRKINGSPSRYVNLFKLVFGNGSLTYPPGGVPLDRAKLGCPNVLESLSQVDDGVQSATAASQGLSFRLVMDQKLVASGSTTQPKLKIFEVDSAAGGDSSLIEIDGADTIAAVTMYVEAMGY